MWGVGLALLAHTLPASAQPKDLTPEAMAEHLAEVGTWQFSARKKGPDGKPECTETWYFASDGTHWVQSGEQRTTMTFAVEQSRDNDLIVWRKGVSVTKGPDCIGRTEDPATYPETRETGFVVMFFNSGGAYTCRPAAFLVDNDGKQTGQRLLRDEDCWGRLDPSSESKAAD